MLPVMVVGRHVKEDLDGFVHPWLQLAEEVMISSRGTQREEERERERKRERERERERERLPPPQTPDPTERSSEFGDLFWGSAFIKALI